MELNEKQSKSFHNITDWITSKNLLFGNKYARTLKGYAGTGKTTLVSRITEWLEFEEINYILCAPTHKAAEVLSSMTGNNVITYHSLLNLSPDLSLEEFDINNPLFKNKSKPKICEKTVILADECSMINKDLTKYLLTLVKECKSKILFIGDPAQLPPINETISETFNFDGDELTEVMRTNVDAILACSTYIRNNLFKTNINLDKFSSDNFIITDKKQILNYYEGLSELDILHHKYLAYRNVNVNSFNKYVNKLLVGSDKIEVGSLFIPFVTGNSDCKMNKENFTQSKTDYHNSSDYRVIEIEPSTFRVYDNVQFRTGMVVFNTRRLKLFNGIDTTYIQLLDSSSYDTFINWYYESVRYIKQISFINGEYGRAKAWSYLLNIKSSLVVSDNLQLSYFNYKATCGFGYGITVHRSQGSTYKSVINNYEDIMTIKDPYLRNRLLYVAVSRASDNVFIIKN